MATPIESGRRRGTVLVSGGAGFIGTAIAPALANEFGRVIAVDNLHPQVHPTAQRPTSLDARVELHVGDVTDPSVWDAVLSEVRPDVVVHLAAETGTSQSLAEASRHAQVNVVGTTQMLDGLLRHDALPARVVLSSSRAVYGEGAWTRPDGSLFYPGQRTSAILAAAQWDFPGAEPVAMAAERVSPAPVSVYGATKLAQEHVLTSWAQSVGVEPVVLRLQNVYGPGQSLINPYTGIMSLFCRVAKAGRSIPLYEDGAVRRDFVLIDDVARAVVAGVLTESPGSVPIDIGSGEDQTIARAAALIADYYGAPEPHVTGQFRQGDVRHAWADVSHAADVLAWEPEFGLEAGVARLAAWIDSQPGVGL
ncbi:SDR family NAD(P)-dependent oxidoreductase [Cellulomonas humilata]|uniref:SDR family NAD(P)-dependent oxidoreductase n=1 Tax=Cellulomonas humilata TaxID=144055 RepID=A0A7Y6A148_9CELL|nr:SDR family NAD(P)-dependent oxidoreductase [Cellulomonas humilata]NUU16965.1 SDR family NAD(P)-dependent oxidoreductase [Cellulomonas humilata]